MRRGAAPAGVLVLLCAAAPAAADPVFTGRVSLGGLFYTESEGGDDLMLIQRSATSSQIGYGELRGVIEGRRLWKERLDLRLDLRLRLTGSLNFDCKFDEECVKQQKENPLSTGISARGYLGGQEYELRQAYARLRLSDRYTLQVGRQSVVEADGLKLDGARLLRQFGERPGVYEGGAFVGLAPNPYSRSLLSDYSSPCGAGVAAVPAAAPESPTVADAAPCEGSGFLFGLAGGLTFKYQLANLWGLASITGAFYNGPGDGGAVQRLDNVTQAGQLLAPPSAGLDAPRVYVSWLNSFRPLERLTLLSDLVVDLYGGGGPQLTRLFVLGTLRLLREDRLSLRLAYTHMSSVAINMYLNRQLYSRLGGSTIGAPMLGVVENNLTVMRTGRDEVRAAADYRVARQLGVFVEGRFRYRALLGGSDNATVFDAALYTDNTRSLAGDATVGVRDNGSLLGVRATLSYTALFNFRADNHVVAFTLGRDFWQQRGSVDLGYTLALTRDIGVGTDTCGITAAASSPFVVGCFGRRSGATHEVGLWGTLNPWRTLFFLLDYRFAAMLTDPQGDPPADIPTVLSHSILMRTEFRW